MRDRGTYSKGPKGKADKLFSLIVRHRGACESCGDAEYRKLQCAHVIRRAYSATRCDEDNALALCWSCHRRFTDNPVDWVDFIDTYLGRAEFARLREKAEAGVKAGRTYWDDEVARLQERCDALGINTKRRAA